MNADEILRIKDDGTFVFMFKDYFATLDDPLYPNSDSPRLRNLTKFHQLMLTAYQDFQHVTEEYIMEMRRVLQSKVIHDVGTYAKRVQLRNLTDNAKFSKEELGLIYDQFQKVQFYQEDSSSTAMRLDFPMFEQFLANMCKWGRFDKMEDEGEPLTAHPFVKILFARFDRNEKGYLDLQDIVVGLGLLVKSDLLGRLEFFHKSFDSTKCGALLQDDVMMLSDTLFYLTRFQRDTRYQEAVTGFLQRAVEFSEIDKEYAKEQAEKEGLEVKAEAEGGNTQEIQLALPAFRMVILADEILERFFESEFANSFRLREPAPDRRKSLGRDVFNSLLHQGNMNKARPRRPSNVSTTVPDLPIITKSTEISTEDLDLDTELGTATSPTTPHSPVALSQVINGNI